jgi:hypothetical protein
MEQVRALLGVPDNDDVPDAIRALQTVQAPAPEDTEKAAQISYLLGELATTMQHRDAALAASEHGPLTDIATLTGLPVRVTHRPNALAEFRFSAHVEGYPECVAPTPREALESLRDYLKGLPEIPSGSGPGPTAPVDPIADLLALDPGVLQIRVFQTPRGYTAQHHVWATPTSVGICADGVTPHEALLALHAKVIAALPASTSAPEPEPSEPAHSEPIVLAPYHDEPGALCRRALNGTWRGFNLVHVRLATEKGNWNIAGADGALAVDGDGGCPAADKAARERYVVLDAAPGSYMLHGLSRRWRRDSRISGPGWECSGVNIDAWVPYDTSRGGGWTLTVRDSYPVKVLAHGPQTGEEGKRFLLAAARALGILLDVA